MQILLSAENFEIFSRTCYVSGYFMMYVLPNCVHTEKGNKLKLEIEAKGAKEQRTATGILFE